MAEYIYKQEGDKFVLYADGAPLAYKRSMKDTASIIDAFVCYFNL